MFLLAGHSCLSAATGVASWGATRQGAGGSRGVGGSCGGGGSRGVGGSRGGQWWGGRRWGGGGCRIGGRPAADQLQVS
jgi:hypothetical protein